jgi:hypothetical protein
MKILLSQRLRAASCLALAACLPLTACEEVVAPKPSTDPIAENSVNITPGGVCAIPETTIKPIGSLTEPLELIDGQCEQSWTNLSFREKVLNPSPAKCQVTYDSGFSYRYSYLSPQTNIAYFKKTSTYELPQTIVRYYLAAQSYDLPQTKIQYYISQQEYDLPNTIVKYFTQQGAYTLTLPGNYTALGCSTFVAGKLPAGALLDPAHTPECSLGASTHKVGSCSAADASVENCKTHFYGKSLVASGSPTSDCLTFASGKIPNTTVIGNAEYPVSCTAIAPKRISGACSPLDSTISNCTTAYAEKTATLSGKYSGVGCETFVSGKLPSGAVYGNPNYPIHCTAGTKAMVGNCSNTDSTIENCTHTYSAQTLANLSGDFKEVGCDKFATGKLPKDAVLQDAKYPISCTEAPAVAKNFDSSEVFASLDASLENFLPIVNANCGDALVAHISQSKKLPLPQSCKITSVLSKDYTYGNSTCLGAKSASYCNDSAGARRNCRSLDIPAESPYAPNLSQLKVKGEISCNTKCSATEICKGEGSLGESYFECSTNALTSTVEKTFTGVESKEQVCLSSQKRIITKGPYLAQVLPTLTANVPDNACIKARVCLNESAWKKLTPVKAIPAIDLVILFDTTSSMTPQIQAMIANLQNLIKNLNAITPKLRLGLASYRDFPDSGGQAGDFPYKVNVPLSGDTKLVTNGLNALAASGGGDLSESLATAIRSAVTGKGMPNYFDDSSLGWENDPARVKIILGISDAADKKAGLPAGAAALGEAADLLKSQGILFLGIGFKKKIEAYAGENSLRSFDDFAFLAQNTGAIVTGSGIDLDGDTKSTSYGEIAPGSPAVLLMTEDGHLEGAPLTADPTKVLADAITKMVETTRPFQFNLIVGSSGRKYSPELNSLSLPVQAEGQQCFTPVNIDPKDAYAACGVNSALNLSVSEASTQTDISFTDFQASLNLDGNCARQVDPPPPVSTNWQVVGFDASTSTNSAILIWQISGSPNLSTATIYAGTRADQITDVLATVTAKTPSQMVTVDGLLPDTTYYFRVDTKDILGNVVSSNVIFKRTKL